MQRLRKTYVRLLDCQRHIVADGHTANRLQETKSSLLDLCSRQLNDLLDEAPSDQKDVEDVDQLLSEMQAVRRSMETMVAFERALQDV